MTHEEMERSMEFVVKQQAQFATDIQRINETIEKHNETFAKHAEAIVALTGLHGRLAEAQARLTETQQDQALKITELAEAGKRTDERLDVLITTVERYISSRNGGRAAKARKRRRKG
jgi:division protein CdvB (Snf7/Vps24/ESCRT-III family)